MPQTKYWPFTKNKATNDEEITEERSVLQRQLGFMEGEVKEMQLELAAIRKDRLDLHNRKQSGVTAESEEITNNIIVRAISDNFPDEKSVHPEILKLRNQLIRANNAADQERSERQKYEGKLKDLELKLNHICAAGTVAEIKESQNTPDGEVGLLKSQLRNVKEELEELKLSEQEKDEQIQGYRMKYLQAQQLAEELKRELDIIEFDNKQVSDQIQIEIQKMKMQFQEKLQELAPLPDLLKAAQMQLEEAKQLQNLAEDSSQQLSIELNRAKEKLVNVVNTLNQEKVERAKLYEDNKYFKLTLNEKAKELDIRTKEVDDYKCKVLRLEEKLNTEEVRFNEKASDCSRLQMELDELREESIRSLGRMKDRSESMRRHMQTQISEMERQLVQSRAQCRACQKERDEIRQRMQLQVNNLQENFEMVEMRLRTIQGQVNSLKCSYSVILAEDDENEYKIATT